MDAVIHQVTVTPLEIPLRTRVRHSAADRGVADPVIVTVELRNGTLGYGETAARSYVTGETVESVLDAIQSVFVPHLVSFHPESFADALAAVESLPWHDRRENLIPAARAAVELAVLDAALGHYGKDIDDVARWSGIPRFGAPGSLRTARFSGVLAEGAAGDILRRLRHMWWGGLRRFKLKVGLPDDAERLSTLDHRLGRKLRSGQAMLRLDANGAWTLGEAVEWFRRRPDFPIEAVEQPLARGRESDLRGFKDRVGVPLIHDESVATEADLRRMIDLGVADGINIRIAKCGGLLPSLRLAGIAHRQGVAIGIGCMVGETSILSAAGLRLLEICPGVKWLEGCFGDRLLSADVTCRSLKFGYGGRPPRLSDPGLGVEVLPDRLKRFCAAKPQQFVL